MTLKSHFVFRLTMVFESGMIFFDDLKNQLHYSSIRISIKKGTEILSKHNALSLDDFSKGVFIVYALGSIISITVFAVEMLKIYQLFEIPIFFS